MKKTEIEQKKKKRDALLTELSKCSGMIRGSLVVTGKKCGREDCECSKGKLHPHRYLSFSEKGKNRTAYVSDVEMRRFKEGVKAYEKAWRLVCQISELNIEIAKGESLDGKTGPEGA